MRRIICLVSLVAVTIVAALEVSAKELSNKNWAAAEGAVEAAIPATRGAAITEKTYAVAMSGGVVNAATPLVSGKTANFSLPSVSSPTLFGDYSFQIAARSGATRPEAVNDLRLPSGFEVNAGQARSRTKFVSHGRGYRLLLSPGEAVLAVTAPASGKARKFGPRAARGQSATVRIKLVGADRKAPMEGIDPLPGRANYFLGSAPQHWRTGIPIFARVVSKHVYPGVDQVYYSSQQQLEFDFRVAPGTDPSRIRLSYSGIERLRIDSSGDLVVSTRAGEIRQHKPRVYQVRHSVSREIGGEYRSFGGSEVGFRVGPYDSREPLIIDPVLTYATYLGGSSDESIGGIGQDASGNIYLAGTTDSTDFRTTTGVLSTTNRGQCDVFISKFTSAGALLYSTYLGGSECDEAEGLAVDPEGNAYVTGVTESTDFPTVNAFQTTNRGGIEARVDAFVAKLNPSGSQLIYSTYLGGTIEDAGAAIAVDKQGNAFVAGFTGSNNFPTTASAYQTAKIGAISGFVTKLSPGGQIVYSTFLGGSRVDYAFGIAVDSADNAYVTGETLSSDFPTTPGAFQTQKRSQRDIFVAKLNPAGSTAVWSTLLGGGDADSPAGIAVDPAGNVYVAGTTYSADFPVTSNAFQKRLNGERDGFLAKINASGTSLLYSTYVGGSESDDALAVAVDATGNAYVSGSTTSSDFPTVAPFQAALRDYNDCFVAKLDTSTGTLLGATYLGGSGDDYNCKAIAVQAGGVFVAGETYSFDLPVTRDAVQKTWNRASDVFLAKLDFSAAAVAVTPSQLSFAATPGSSIPVQALSLTATAGVQWTIEITNAGRWLSVSPLSGTGSATILVTIDTTGLRAGSTYPSTVYVKNQASGATLAIIPVTVSVLQPATSVSAASFTAGGALAPESIASAFGQGLATSTASAASSSLPTTLADRTVTVKDSAGTERKAPLFFVSPSQINYLVPRGTAVGKATLTVMGLFGTTAAIGELQIATVAPALFAANGNGQGVAAAVAVRAAADSSQSTVQVFQCGTNPGSCISTPIDLGPETDQVFLVLFGTGIRGRSALSAVTVKVGGADAEVTYAGPQGKFAGLDQVNVRLPRSLIGRGEVDVALAADGAPANKLTVNVK